MGVRSHRNALTTGYKLHWYIIRSILGQGGFGITYLAFDSNLQREVAIKEFFPSDLVVRDNGIMIQPVSESHVESYSAGLERFIQEAQTLAKFKHPNIVPVLAVFEENNTGYMVMNYEHGHSLQQALSGRNTLTEDEINRILFPVLDGMEAVHNAGFIHRDLKPANIFLREDGAPVLLDFGSARYSLKERTNTLTSLVSPGYAPYEQYQSKGEDQGPWTDIYGIGATLYRAVTGIPPADAISRSKALLETSNDIYVSALEICEDKYSRSLLNAIDHALEFIPADRPQTASQWRDELNSGDVVDTISLKISPADQRTRPATERVVKESSRRPAARPYIYMLLLVLITVLLYKNQDYLIHDKTPAISHSITDGTDIPVDTSGKIPEQTSQMEASEAVQMENEILPEPGSANDTPEINAGHEQDQARLLSEIEDRRTELERQQQLAAEIRKENEEKQKQLQLQEQMLEEEKRIMADKRKAGEYQSELMAARVMEEKRKQIEIRKTAEFNRLLYEAQQSLSEGDYNTSVSKYVQALAIYADNTEAQAGLNRARAVREICSGIIGEWLWFNGGLTTFFESGIIMGEHRYLDNSRGKWKCSDPAMRKFTIMWDNKTGYDLILSADRQRLNGVNRDGVRISGTRGR